MPLSMILALAVWAQTAGYPALVRQGRAEYGTGHFAVAEKLFSEALSQLHPGDERERASILTELGATYIRQAELTKAEHAYLECLSIFRRLSDNGGAALMLHNVGLV